MVTRSGYKSRALSFVLALVCLCWAAAAFAQSATGTITGTVVDGTGAALPGATVNVTEAATGTVRTATTDAAGLFRFAALNPGRYSLAVELASFRTLNVADIALLSTEVRDLGKLGLQIGGVTETVTITSEVTPVQVADSSRRSHAHAQDDIATIPTKGRDIFGMLGVAARRAGYEPQSRLHPVALRDFDHHQRHALAEQGRPRRRHQHRRRGRMRHRLREPQHGRGRRSAGHRQRLHGGERPQ